MAEFIPATDEATATTWIDELTGQGANLKQAWARTELHYNVMMSQRSSWGYPKIDENWTQDDEDQFWTMHYAVGKIVEYCDEVGRRVRAVAYDPSIKSIVALATVGEPTFKLNDQGRIVISVAGNEQVIISPPSGMVGAVPWNAIAGVAVAAAVLGVAYLATQGWMKKCDQAAAADLQKHTVELTEKYGPEQAKKILDAETDQIVKTEEAKAKSHQSSDAWAISTAIKYAAISLGVVAVLGSAAYFSYTYWPGRKHNPTKGSAVSKHGGYVWATTYQTYTEEDLWAGETDNRGWENEFEDSSVYKSLADLLQDIPSHSWVEWSSSHPRGGDWITSEADENYRTGDRTNYDLFIKHADGTNLTRDELKYVDSKLRLRGHFGG